MFVSTYYKLNSGSLDLYESHERIGTGSYGTVHRAIDRDTGRVVAIKQPKAPNGDIFKRFCNEIDFYSQTADSPFVVKMLDHNLSHFRPFIALEFCNNGNVRDRMWETQINRTRTIGLLWQIATAITDFHARGILHRDLKPENLMLSADVNNNWIAKVGDPGMVCFPQRSVFDFGATRTAKGTLHYIAPELYTSNAIYRAPCDIFSFGITAYEMLTGRRIMGGSLVSGLGGKLDNLLTRMVSLSPSARPTAAQITSEFAIIYHDELASAKTRREIGLLIGTVLAAIGIGHFLTKTK